MTIDPDALRTIYELLEWPSNPRTPAGKRRLFEALEVLKQVVQHEWLREVLEKRRHIRIVDVCSGGGIAGFALSRILIDMGLNVSLTLVDMRTEELEEAEKFRDEWIPQLTLETLSMDARELYRIDRKFDIALMWGLSAPHFDPWNMMKVFASLNKVLEDHGVFVLEETDRVLTIFLKHGYRYVWTEGFGDKAIISLHRRYDIVRGTVRRVSIDLESGKKAVADYYPFWNIASLASMLWIFFEDVDIAKMMFIPATYRNMILLAKRPRRMFDIETFIQSKPSILDRELTI